MNDEGSGTPVTMTLSSRIPVVFEGASFEANVSVAKLDVATNVSWAYFQSREPYVASEWVITKGVNEESVTLTVAAAPGP